MIYTRQPLRPPLRRPERITRVIPLSPHLQIGGSRTRPVATPLPACENLAPLAAPSSPVPPTSVEERRKEPPSPPALREYFCRHCDRRVSGGLPPPGWLNLRRHIVPGSLGSPFPELPKLVRKIQRQRVTMGLGFFCSWECLTAAMPRLGELHRSLQNRGIGLRPLSEGEAPPRLPPVARKGGPG
jgi:hypothetical protein